ncbi:YqjK-like family protein [Providencia burhodogranariea]|uniref:Cell division protein FtsH n=1 Tax=Providencia burhodogranariea DSM 19968 TaxID=1141662 RepID=K8WDY0_9GAMM|nr:YqjK-like family protein [Providencia burhodogranariea]EKT58136.1 hypothetical protein OOA_13457 [Providencia burhodogranariea DSM 19968]
MSKNKRQSLAEKKQQLVTQIEQQRADLTTTSRDWLQVTEPYDRSWQVFVSFKPIFIAAAGLVSVYILRRPKRILSLGEKALTTWGIIRSFQGAVKTSKK